MTLDKDRKKNLRPPMGKVAFTIIIGLVVAVFVFVAVILITNQIPLF